MKIWIILLLVFLSSIGMHAQENSLLATPYQPSFQNGTIGSFLDDIQQRTKLILSFSAAAVNADRQVQLQNRAYSVQEALNIILDKQKVSIIERKEKILIIPASEARKLVRNTTFTVNGYVKDAGSKEVLLGSIVYIPGLQAGTATNNYGFYSLSLPEGKYSIVCSYVGYKTDTFELDLEKDRRMDLQLSSQTSLSEVKITTEKGMLPGHTHLTYDDIDKKPMLLGESDVMRALQNEAGVQAGMEGSNTIYVRGGEPGQNMHLLDGVPLYYTNHFGFTSIFNADAIKSVDFHKGAFPARYSGRSASIIEVSTKDGDMQHWGGQFTMGLLKGSLNLEGPIVKDRASIMISGRRTWIDGLWRAFTNDLKIDFHDLNIKTNYIVNKNNRVYLSFYTGRDQLGMDMNGETANNRSGNTIFSGKWNTILTPKFFLNTLVTYSKYRYTGKGTKDPLTGDSLATDYIFRMRSSINEAALRLQAHWYLNTYHHIEMGGHYSKTDFVPTVSESESKFTGAGTTLVDPFKSNELDLYLEDNIKLNDKWTLRPGLHWSNWFNKDMRYASMQPRIYASFSPSLRHTIHGSFTQMTQFLHSINGSLLTSIISNNNVVNWNTEAWFPSTESILPQESLQGTFGYTGKPVSHLEYGVDFYYKDIVNVPMYDSRKFIYDNSISWKEKIIQGKGWSYGMEVFAKSQLGPVRASIAYTLSWNWRRYTELNEGKAFPFRYDRRHNLKIAAIYQPNRAFDASANWTFMTGEAITLPDHLYPDFDNNLGIDQNGTQFNPSLYNYTYTSVNNYRLPPIHRLDVGVNFHKQKGRRVERTWSLGMFNT